MEIRQAQEIEKVIVEKSESLIRGDGNIVAGLDEISAHLESLDPTTDPFLRKIDERLNNMIKMDLETYFFAAYSSTRDFARSLQIYKNVRSLARYIALMDRFYEVGDKECLNKARGMIESVMRRASGHMRYSTKFSLRKCWPFWEFERETKDRMVRGDSFSDRDLRYFNLFKSSDAPILYSNVLDSELSDFNLNVVSAIHYKQAFIDMLDDLADIEEDVGDKMPNVFVLAASSKVPFSQIAASRDVRKSVLTKDVASRLLKLVGDYEKGVRSIQLPKNFAFITSLSAHYAGELKKSLGAI